MDCPNCRETATIEEKGVRHPWAIARLSTGYVSLNSTQFYRGATFFVARPCVAELHELEPSERRDHLFEMAAVAASVQRAVGAPKMNYEALGNTVPHLHWWLTPRHADDPRPRAPIWENLDFLRLHWTGQAHPDEETSLYVRRAILTELRREDVDVQAAYV